MWSVAYDTDYTGVVYNDDKVSFLFEITDPEERLIIAADGEGKPLSAVEESDRQAKELQDVVTTLNNVERMHAEEKEREMYRLQKIQTVVGIEG